MKDLVKRSFEVKQCTLRDYPALLKFLDVAFNKEIDNWFQEYLPHIFRATDTFANCNYICKDDESIVGAIGIYPLQFKIGSAIVKVGGIGSVSVHPEYRNFGIMSDMLLAANKMMRDQGYALSWLGGERFRYLNYGWDFGGKVASFRVHSKDIVRHFPVLPKVQMLPVDESSIIELSKAQERNYSYVIRDPETLLIHINRRRFIWHAGRSSSGFAYCVSNRNDQSHIVEICGDPKTAIALLLSITKHSGVHDFSISLPYAIDDPLFADLFTCGADFSFHHSAQISVINTDLAWNHLLPEIRKRFFAADEKPITDDLTKENKLAIIKRAIGFFDDFPRLGKGLNNWECVKPLPWWMSNVDGV